MYCILKVGWRKEMFFQIAQISKNFPILKKILLYSGHSQLETMLFKGHL